MKRVISSPLVIACALQCVLLLLCLLPVTGEGTTDAQAQSALRCQGIERLTTDGGQKDQIQISNDRVAWAQGDTVKVLELATMDVRTIGLKVNFSLKMSGNTMLIDNKIYDLDSGSWTKMVTPKLPFVSMSLCGDHVVYSMDVSTNSTSHDYEIYHYDIPKAKAKRLTTNDQYQSQPAIWGSDAVWVDGRNGHTEIYHYDVSSVDVPMVEDVGSRLTYYDSSKAGPDIFGDRVVWADSRNPGGSMDIGGPDFDIYMCNITTNTTTQITTDISAQKSPRIYGDRIVYNDQSNGDYDVCLYSISEAKEVRLQNSTKDQLWPRIWGDKVVWFEAGGMANPNGEYSDLDVYMCDLALDFDKDQIPNYMDPDDDNDGYTDAQEIANGTDPSDGGKFPVKKRLSDDDDRNITIMFVAIAAVVILIIAGYVLYMRMKK